MCYFLIIKIICCLIDTFKRKKIFRCFFHDRKALLVFTFDVIMTKKTLLIFTLGVVITTMLFKEHINEKY